MKQSKKVLSLLLAMIMVFAMVLPAAADEAAKPISAEVEEGKIVILHTNDVHGSIDQKLNEEAVTNIGYAGVAAYKAEMAAQYGETNVTLVDAGDAIQGEAICSLTKGSVAVEIMNKVGYDLAIPGNHEFDYGMDNFLDLAKNKAEYPYLCCNFTDLEGNAIFDPYKILTYGDVKVAYVGIDTPETFTKSTPTYFQNEKGEYIYSFQQGNSGKDLYAAVQKAVDAAKAEGADYVVAMGHLGDNGSTEEWKAQTVIANTNGIDVFIDGHSHEQIEKTVANKDGQEVVWAQTGTKLANIGKIVIDTTTKEITHELVSGYAKQDEDVAKFVKEKNDAFEAQLQEVVATNEVLLTTKDANGTRLVRSGETNLGDLCADAYRVMLGADVAFVNGGGVRADIAAGNVTYQNIIDVHPFGNEGCVVETTGQNILDALEFGSKNYPEESGGFLQVSGLTYTIDATIPSSVTMNDEKEFVSVDGDYRVKDVMVNGEPLDVNKTYTLASHNYMLKDGGDGFVMFKNDKLLKDCVMIDNAILINYIKDELKGTVTAEQYAEPQGRITIKRSVADVYSDVAADSWFKDAVQYVYDNDLMKGTDNGFEPNKELTNAETYQILYNLAGQPKVENVLENVKDEWYADAVSWIAAEGLADGEDFTEAVILRGDVVTLLTKYFAKENKSIKGLFYGDEKGELGLDQSLTRAQMAAILSRIPELKELGTEALTTKVIDLGKYGNATTDITKDVFAAAGFEVGDMIKVEITGVEEPLVFPYGTGYSNVDQGSEVARVNSAGTIDLAISRGDFGTTYGLGVKGEDGVYTITEGKTITISMAEKGAWLEEIAIRDIDSKRTNVREDYSSDEVYANFRAIKMGDIGEGILYRTSSPVNPELGRNTYADNFLKEAGVKTVINLADSKETMEGYEGYADTYYATLEVLPMNMGVDMQADDSKAKLKEAFEFMIANEGPYAFHCTEGKDRAGYFAIVLEALMGGTVEEITADYMVSYENYYHVEKDSDQWKGIAARNVTKDLMKLAGVETEEDLAKADLVKATETYLTETIGLTAEQVTALKEVLSTSVADALPAAA